MLVTPTKTTSSLIPKIENQQNGSPSRKNSSSTTTSKMPIFTDMDEGLMDQHDMNSNENFKTSS